MRGLFIRLFKVLGYLFSGVLILVASLALWLSTPPGSRFLVRSAISNLPAELVSVEFAELDGSLWGELVVSDLRLRTDVIHLDAATMSLALDRVELWQRRLGLESLSLGEARLTLTTEGSGGGGQSDVAAEWELPRKNPLPLPIAIERLQLDRAEIVRGEQSWLIDRANLGLEMDEGVARISAAQLDGNAVPDLPLTLDGKAELKFGDQPRLEMSLAWQADSLDLWQWQGAAGELSLSGDTENLQISHTLDRPFAVRSSGAVQGLGDFANLRFELEHELSRALELPLAEPVLVQSLSLNSSGGLEQQSIAFVSTVEALDKTLQLDFSGTRNGTAISPYTLRVDGPASSLVLAGEYGQQGQASASGAGSISLSSEDLAGLLPDESPWQRGDADVEFQLNLDGATPVGQLSLTDLVIDAGAAAIQGQVSLDIGTQATAVDADLSSDGNSLQLDGQVLTGQNNELDLDWRLQAPSLERSVAGMSGSVTSAGSLGGTPERPSVEASLQVENFSAFDFNLGRLRGTVNLNAATLNDPTSNDPTLNEESLELALSGTALTLADGRTLADDLDVSVQGTLEAHSFRLAASQQLAGVQASGRGSLDISDGYSWESTLEDSRLSSELGAFQQQSPFSFSLLQAATSSDLTFELGSGAAPCWENGPSRLCLQRWSNSSTERSSVMLENVPLAWLNANSPLVSILAAFGQQLPLLSERAAFGGEVDARLSFISSAPMESLELLSVANGATLTVETVLDIEDDVRVSQLFSFPQLQFDLRRQQQGWLLESGLRVFQREEAMNNQELQGSASLSLQIGDDETLDGTVNAGLVDLQFIEALIPDVDILAGELVSSLRFAGSLSQPQLLGELVLSDAGVAVSSAGIELSNVQLQIVSMDSDVYRLEGNAESGQGQLSVSGELRSPWQDLSLGLQVQGQDFELYASENLQARVTPMLELKLSQSIIDIQGDLALPSFFLSLQELPESVIDVSNDVVLIDSEGELSSSQLPIHIQERRLLDLPMALDLSIELGDQVSIDAFGLTAMLDGSLRAQQEPGGVTQLFGSLSTRDGRYQAYRQSLNLSYGELLFAGDMTNPGVSMRASREVEDVTVGVLVDGTLKTPVSRLFSSPVLPEADALTMLATGRSLNTLQGSLSGPGDESDSDMILGTLASLGLQRSDSLISDIRDRTGLDALSVSRGNQLSETQLMVGKYITPRLFLQYGVGLFESLSLITLDYEISRRLFLRAETGEYQSIDLLYTNDR